MSEIGGAIASAPGWRDLLVLLDDGDPSAARLLAAMAAAGAHGAELTGIFVAPSPTPLPDSPGGGDTGGGNTGGGDTAAKALRRLCARRETDTKAAETTAVGLARDRGVAARWCLATGDWDGVLRSVIDYARTADLVIAGVTAPTPTGEPRHGLGDMVLFSAGRPVLFVPDDGPLETFGSHVVVAWNSSREAARAVNDALPMLMRAEEVTVLTVENDPDGDAVPAHSERRIASHLARHGIGVTLRQSYVNNVGVGETILSRVAEIGADLLVMGAYGHFRERRLVLGAATRHLLGHMTVPVLMSH